MQKYKSNAIIMLQPRELRRIIYMANLKLASFKVLNLSKNKSSTIASNTQSKNNIENAAKEANKDKNNEQAVNNMVNGHANDSHQATIAIDKAETSMKIMLEVRNKAMNAYKEILRMQV